MNRRLIKVLSNHSENTSRPGKRTCTLWYNKRRGTVYGVGDGSPVRDDPRVNQANVETVHLLYDGLPRAELAFPEQVRITSALQKALDQIRDYRKETQGQR
jgi:hypothetical protein